FNGRCVVASGRDTEDFTANFTTCTAGERGFPKESNLIGIDDLLLLAHDSVNFELVWICCRFRLLGTCDLGMNWVEAVVSFLALFWSGLFGFGRFWLWIFLGSFSFF